MKPLLPAMFAISLTACGNDNSAPQTRPNPSPPASEWNIGPIISGKNYSLGSLPTPTKTADGYSFPLGPQIHVHYVTRATGPLSAVQSITLRYRLDLPEGASMLPSSNPVAGAPALITLYFQRSGDDWSGTAQYETYRWWATFATQTLEPGEHIITASMDGNWSAVMTSDRIKNPQPFLDALAHADKVGFTLGGGTGFGHGVFATVPATFTILSFTVQ